MNQTVNRMTSLTLEQRLAQCFMVGSDSPNLMEEMDPFLKLGLGGIIWFRHHFNDFDGAEDIRDYFREVRTAFGKAPVSWMGLDQEGGQVERLPHWLFPTSLFALSFAQRGDLAFCQEVHRQIAQRLKWIGFNLNFAPTVDLNRERANPIIGVRAYGDEVETVVPYARAVMLAHKAAGVLPVVKHFPGHGSGLVDSHLDLPRFDAWQADELEPYRHLLADGMDAVLVAHGLYPALFESLGAKPTWPSSMNPAVVEGLLRSDLKFDGGLVFSDDMTMGAISERYDPQEAALMALQAGVDVLVYRRAQPEAWEVYQFLLQRIRQGKLSESLIEEKANRILAVVDRYDRVEAPVMDLEDWSKDACHQQAVSWARMGMRESHHYVPSPMPLSPKARWALVMPNQLHMVHYRDDLRQAPPLTEWCRRAGIVPTVTMSYPLDAMEPWFSTPEEWPVWEGEGLDTIVFIGFNALKYPNQAAYYKRLMQAHPQAKRVLVSSGMPTDADVCPSPWVYLNLPSYRPAVQELLAQWLVSPPSGFDGFYPAQEETSRT